MTARPKSLLVGRPQRLVVEGLIERHRSRQAHGPVELPHDFRQRPRLQIADKEEPLGVLQSRGHLGQRLGPGERP